MGRRVPRSSPHPVTRIEISRYRSPHAAGSRPIHHCQGLRRMQSAHHWSSSGHGLRQEHMPAMPGRLPELQEGGTGLPLGVATLCPALPGHAPRDPSPGAAAGGGSGAPGVGLRPRARHLPGAGLARLGHSTWLARVTGDVRAAGAPGPAGTTLPPSLPSLLRPPPPPRTHSPAGTRSSDRLRAQHPGMGSGQAKGRPPGGPDLCPPTDPPGRGHGDSSMTHGPASLLLPPGHRVHDSFCWSVSPPPLVPGPLCPQTPAEHRPPRPFLTPHFLGAQPPGTCAGASGS